MKTDKELIRIAKYITLLLRHQPEKEHLSIDKYGYVFIKDLISKLKLSLSELDIIVKTDNKSRFSYDTSKKKIRCSQGHSIDVDVQLKEEEPPDILYHGTSWKYVESIFKTGIEKRNRLYVHLSKDVETATTVGKRHGELYIFEIDTKKMYKDGIKFYLSENKVWLTEYIDVMYLLKSVKSAGFEKVSLITQ